MEANETQAAILTAARDILKILDSSIGLPNTELMIDSINDEIRETIKKYLYNYFHRDTPAVFIRKTETGILDVISSNDAGHYLIVIMALLRNN